MVISEKVTYYCACMTSILITDQVLLHSNNGHFRKSYCYACMTTIFEVYVMTIGQVLLNNKCSNFEESYLLLRMLDDHLPCPSDDNRPSSTPYNSNYGHFVRVTYCSACLTTIFCGHVLTTDQVLLHSNYRPLRERYVLLYMFDDHLL